MERAQKLSQDSNAALEMYQREVRTLEEQLGRSVGRSVGRFVRASLSLLFLPSDVRFRQEQLD